MIAFMRSRSGEFSSTPLSRSFGRTIRNILVKARAGLLLREKKFAVSVWKYKRHMAEEEHFAALQLVAMPWSLLQIVIGYVKDGRTAG